MLVKCGAGLSSALHIVHLTLTVMRRTRRVQKEVLRQPGGVHEMST